MSPNGGGIECYVDRNDNSHRRYIDVTKSYSNFRNEKLSAINEDFDSEELGCIEVLNVVSKGKTYNRILYFPPEGNSKRGEVVIPTNYSASLLDGELDEPAEQQQQQQQPPPPKASLSDQILDTLVFACMVCEPYCATAVCQQPVKGILKKPSDPSSLRSSRNVSFSSLDIKEFHMTLGDHPSATSGPPVMLDYWEDKPKQRVVSLEEYEQMRSPRRKRKQLKLSYRDRKGILEKEKGFSREEVNMAWTEALKIQHQRHETLRRGLLMMTMDDIMESMQRKYKRVADTIGIP